MLELPWEPVQVRRLSDAMSGENPSSSETPFEERYDLQEKLGEGGFGIVYKAYDYKLRRDVAVKLLKSADCSDKDRKRFLREAEALARLKHPHIVNIYDYGDYDDQVYIVMDCLEGESLATIVGSEKDETSIDQYTRWLLSIAEALTEVHEEGLVHRDLKSHNIMIDWDQNAHLLDFGLVFLSDAHSRLTKTEGSLGTPSYMSPEQARGQVVDARADIYGWGATLYECLTQRVPFEGVTALNVLHKVIHDDPIEPSHWNRRVPADLDVICLKCLEKEPESRYQSADELIADLRRFLAGEAILARPRTWAEKTWRRIQRRKLAATLAFALIFTIFTGAAAFLVQLKQSYDKEQNYFEDIAAKNRQLQEAAETDQQRLKEIEEQKKQLMIERDNVLQKQKRVAQNKKLHKNSNASFILKFSRYLAVIGESPQSIGFRDDLEKTITGTASFIANPEQKKRYESALTYHRWRGHSVAPLPLMTFEAENARDGVWLKDNEHLILIHSRKEVQLFHAPSGTVLREFKGQQKQVTSVAVTPDEKILVVGDAYGYVQMWDLKSGESLRRFRAHKRILRRLRIAPDGQRFLTASDDPSVALWDFKSEKPLHVFPHKDKVLCVEFSKDSKKAYSGGLGKQFRVLDLVDLRVTHSHPVKEMIRAIAVNPNDKEVAFSSYDGDIHLWNTTTHKVDRAIYTRFTTLALNYNSTGDKLYAGRSSSVIQIWDPRTGRELRPLAHGENATQFLSLSPNNQQVLVGCRSGNARLLPTQHKQELRTLTAPDDQAIEQLSLSPDGAWIIGHSQSQCFIWEAETGQLIRQWKGHASPIRMHELRSDGKELFLGTESGELVIWNLETERQSLKKKVHDSAVTAIAFNQDKTRLATGCEDGLIKEWDWPSIPQTPKQELKGHRREVTGLIYYPGHPYLYSSSLDQYVRQWDLKTKKSKTWCIRSPVSGLAPITLWGQPDKLDAVAACGFDGNVMRIYASPGSMGSGSGSSRLSRARLLAYNQETGTLFGAGLDGTLSLWLKEGLSRASNISEFSEAPGVITSLSVARNGLKVVTVKNGRGFIWDFQRALRYPDFHWVLDFAGRKLGKNPKDVKALTLLRDWYVFRRQYAWAQGFQERLDAIQGPSQSLHAGRLAWVRHDFLKASQIFERCLKLKREEKDEGLLRSLSEDTLKGYLKAVRRKVKSSQ